MDNETLYQIYIYSFALIILLIIFSNIPNKIISIFKSIGNTIFEKQKNVYKILLASAFLVCLIKMPYWYYQLIRILGMVGFIYFTYLDSRDKFKVTPQLFVIAAIIINPIIKISFDKDSWQCIDIIFSILLFLSIIFEKRLITNRKIENDDYEPE
jgi:hypothetical protein